MKKTRGGAAAAAAVPDAWEDDDWETQADKAAAQDDASKHDAEDNAPGGAPLTKTERLAQHVESNRKLWESAETPQQTFHFLEASSNVPLTSSFKPQVKVLSRKPVIARRGDPASGMANLSVNDDDDDGEKKEVQLTPEEIRAKQKRDREEKQRRYDEARAKIFGESAPSSRGSSPGTGTTTPPRLDGGRHPGQGRGRGRGGGAGRAGGGGAGVESRQTQDLRRNTAAQNGPATRELYDPNHSTRPDTGPLRRGVGADGDSSTRSPPPKDDAYQPIRAPRGPDGSGRGFGFARRGARGS
ncbi:SUZ domain-containing protein [Purpureocillium lilacinum]|uniref:SUZ domain-containing protein n=1 Tax=Purpureocillium lilacinum TaxID=33203 RepID=A0A179HLQ3_PURLI|nr:SUZ domain-containing protein [Purpureocillium lilacinum]OAQ90934.1 SUZ domain-containing protein [Purpureocillium lilacinum]GJN68445.1 hypothetical protein PLICBS_002488 [Purpureocillium lilacinum]GJN77880.1 hypothetical protein PLIIFM63780_001373 [Purpureocillium lilacinum]